MTPRVARIWVPVFVVLLAGCSGEGAQPGADVADVYRIEIDRILAGDPSDLEREVLADCHVSDAEYRQAQEGFQKCIEQAGYGVDVFFPDTGGYDLSQPAAFVAAFDSQEAADAAFQEFIDNCAAGTLDYIEWLFHDMRDNPRGLTYLEALRECFEANDVPDGAGLSDAEFEELVFSDQFQPSTPEGQACEIDPFG